VVKKQRGRATRTPRPGLVAQRAAGLGDAAQHAFYVLGLPKGGVSELLVAIT
jgi:hypothetical protein